MTYPFTNIEAASSAEEVAERRQLYMNQRQRAPWRANRMAIFFLAAVFLLIATASEAEADVFTKKQRLLAGLCPSTIPLNYDSGLSYTGTIPIGAPIHIVYGIQVTSTNTSPSAVSLAISFLPTTGFVPTAVQCRKFPGGVAPGTPFTASLPSILVGPLAATDDKVIVVINGYFKQAGATTVNFAASRPAPNPASETTSLNMNADILTLPADISITKLVKPNVGGAYGSTTSVPVYPSGGTVKYKLIVKNESNIDNNNHTTDLYLGPLLKVSDLLSAPNTNDALLTITASNFSCTASPGAVCPQVPSGALPTLTMVPGQTSQQFMNFTYPSGSSGALPAQGSFEITFDAVISTPSLCSLAPNNQLVNNAFLTYSNSTNTISDTLVSNNTTNPPATVQGTNIPPNCPPTVQVTVDKTLMSPATPSWGQVFRYKITITNPTSTPLSGLKLVDKVYNNGGPPFKAIFNASSVFPFNPVCTPACNTPFPVSNSPVINPSNTVNLFTAYFSLGPNAQQIIEYDVKYDQVCASTAIGGSIQNTAIVSGPASSPVSGIDTETTPMPALPQCPLQVTKNVTTVPTPFSSFPATIGYQVKYENTSPTTPVTVNAIIDAISLDSQAYAYPGVNATYSYTCTANGVTNISPLSGSGSPVIQFNATPSQGIKVINFSSAAGSVFSPLGTLTCNVSVTLNQPPTNDSLCQGSGTPNLVNMGLMGLSYPYNTNEPPTFSQVVKVPLPKCVSILAGKTSSANAFAGGPVTFTLTVKNVGSDVVSNIKLNDLVPSAFTNVTWTCVSGCSSSGLGNNISLFLNPLNPGATATIQVTATAPNVVGTYCNTTDVTIKPFPLLTYFEGNQSALTTATSCIQVGPRPEDLRASIQKTVIGVPASFAGSFNFNAVCTEPGGPPLTSSHTISFSASDPLTTFKGLPAKTKNLQIGLFLPGTTCTVTEVGPLPPLSPNCSWQTSYFPTNGTLTITNSGLNPIQVRNQMICNNEDTGRQPGNSAKARLKKSGRR